MSDYTVKREKEGILRIQAEGTKMPGPLTINERDYADDKQLIVGSGSSSPVSLANIVFHTPTDEEHIGTYVNFVRPSVVCTYTPAQEGFPALASALPDDVLDMPANAWNSENMPIIVPAAFSLTNGYPESFELEITGDAEIMSVPTVGNVLYITGDCTITVKPLVHRRNEVTTNVLYSKINNPGER